MALAPGAAARAWSRAFGRQGAELGAQTVLRSAISDARPEHLLVLQFLRIAPHRRSDVRLDAGQPYLATSWPRQPVAPG
eukprot:10282002-Alexandrium_andersonii.AAC.1